MRKVVTILFVTLLNICALYGQISPVVEVSRDYQVKLTDARKPFVSSVLPDYLQDFNIGFDYTIFNRPVSDLYDFTPQQVVALAKVPTEKLPHLSFMAGAQYPLAPNLDIYFQHATQKFDFGLYGHHNSFFGNINAPSLGEYNTSRRHYDAGMYAKFVWGTGEAKLNASYSLNNVKDKELSLTDAYSLSNNNILKVDFSIKSANPDPKSFYYDILFSFKNGSSNYSQYTLLEPITYKENLLNVKARVGSSFEAHRIYLDVQTSNCWYGPEKSLGIVEFTPIYQYQKGAIDAKLGIKFSSLYGLYETTKIHPYLDAKVELKDKALWLHATISGENEIESYSSFADVAPWLVMNPSGEVSNRFLDSKLDAKFAIESKLFKRLSVNVFGSYAIYDSKLQMMPVFVSSLYSSSAEVDPNLNYMSTFMLTPYYADFSRLTAGVEASFSAKSVNVIGLFKYNTYNSRSEDPIYLMPKYEAFIEATYNLMNKLYMSAFFSYKGKLPYMSQFLPDYKDLGIRVQYNISPIFAVYLKGGNLLNAENQILPFVQGMPRNFGGGLCIDF